MSPIERLLDMAVAALHERDPDELWPLITAGLLRGCEAGLLIHKNEALPHETGAVHAHIREGTPTAPGRPSPAAHPPGLPVRRSRLGPRRSDAGDGIPCRRPICPSKWSEDPFRPGRQLHALTFTQVRAV